MPYVHDYYADQQEIVQPVDYEIRGVLKKSLIREAKTLSQQYRRKDIQDFINNTIAYLKECDK